ncbi:hypothetical protein EV126DRAFT_411252 [Verticillium dahliae]|nr:hypothetical protein EV126DRAFT_411252 [Verticillium dahliae]
MLLQAELLLCSVLAYMSGHCSTRFYVSSFGTGSAAPTMRTEHRPNMRTEDQHRAQDGACCVVLVTPGHDVAVDPPHRRLQVAQRCSAR